MSARAPGSASARSTASSARSAGHVRIYSELGEGTTVKIYLPRYTGDEDATERDSRAKDTARAIGAETILVVEDDEALRSYTTEILGELGYRVLAAHDGASALRVLDGNPIDLLFTDIVMPGGMNGRQLADEAMRRRPGLKVLFTTGYTRNAIVHHGRLDAGVQMIGKPFSFSELSAKLRVAFGSLRRRWRMAPSGRCRMLDYCIAQRMK